MNLARTTMLFVPRGSLPSAEYGVFQRLGRRKAQSGPRRNLDLLASSRVAAYTGLELALAEYSKTCQSQRALFPELFCDQVVEFVECGLSLPLGDADLVGQVSRHLRLCHPPPPKPLSILTKMNDYRTEFKMGRAFQAPADDFRIAWTRNRC